MPIIPGPTPPPSGSSGSVTCSQWTTPELVRACCGGLEPDYDLTSAIQFASEILFRLSGRQYPGLCTHTLWPCQGDSCSGSEDAAWSALSASDWHFGSGSHPSTPYRTGNGWANCWDCGDSIGSGACGGSCYLPWLTLPGPIQDVVEVVIDGQILPRSAFVINDNRRIGRVDGGSWPCSNNLSSPFPFSNPVFSLEVNAASGSYGLVVSGPQGQVSVSPSSSASASSLRVLLESVVGAGNVTVSGGPGNSGGTSPYLISFSASGMGFAPILTATSAGLSGGNATAAVDIIEAGSAPAPNGWYVTYTYGKPVPPGGVFAASLFACQVALARCGSSNCVLPARLKEISREDVSMAFADPLEFIGKGEVGLYEVDLWLNSVNPSKLKRRASIYRADSPTQAKRFS